ncbi:amino acid aldolase [Bacillaceae bacterium JMAK1]|nr:amino acid aldolase [Bacillaceae bacterium JMAK1]
MNLPVELIRSQTLPALFLDVDALNRNLTAIAKRSQGKSIRLATKSIRSLPLLKHIVNSSQTYQGVMSYSVEEANWLYTEGIDDILVAYPSTDRHELHKLTRHMKAGANITVMVDDDEHLSFLQAIAHNEQSHFWICIDVDMSTNFNGFHFGVRRSPLRTAEKVVQFAKRIQNYPNLKLVGLMGYEAQLAGVTDYSDHLIKDFAIKRFKKASVKKVHTRRQQIIKALRKEGIELSFINGGGTGSLMTTAQDDSVTELTVGSGLYQPTLFDHYSSFQYDPALYFALPVVRKPTSQIYTCLGGGYVASGTPGKDRLPSPVYPEDAQLLSLEGAGEVQTPIHCTSTTLAIGDPVIFRPAKAGEVCERFTSIVLIQNEQIVGHVPTYRGEGICFL